MYLKLIFIDVLNGVFIRMFFFLNASSWAYTKVDNSGLLTKNIHGGYSRSFIRLLLKYYHP